MNMCTNWYIFVMQSFKELPDAQKVTFVQVPPADLRKLLPNLPASDIQPEHKDCLDLLEQLLVYPPDQRLHAADALKHELFESGLPFLLPLGYPIGNSRGKETWGGRGLADILSQYLSAAR